MNASFCTADRLLSAKLAHVAPIDSACGSFWVIPGGERPSDDRRSGRAAGSLDRPLADVGAVPVRVKAAAKQGRSCHRPDRGDRREAVDGRHVHEDLAHAVATALAVPHAEQPRDALGIRRASARSARGCARSRRTRSDSPRRSACCSRTGRPPSTARTGRGTKKRGTKRAPARRRAGTRSPRPDRRRTRCARRNGPRRRGRRSGSAGGTRTPASRGGPARSARRTGTCPETGSAGTPPARRAN